MSDLSLTIQVLSAVGVLVWLVIIWDMWRNRSRL